MKLKYLIEVEGESSLDCAEELNRVVAIIANGNSAPDIANVRMDKLEPNEYYTSLLNGMQIIHAIRLLRELTNKYFGVTLPLLYAKRAVEVMVEMSSAASVLTLRQNLNALVEAARRDGLHESIIRHAVDDAVDRPSVDDSVVM